MYCNQTKTCQRAGEPRRHRRRDGEPAGRQVRLLRQPQRVDLRGQEKLPAHEEHCLLLHVQQQPEVVMGFF